MKTLMPHQEDALSYAMQVKHPALLMEMRLGKTLVTIRYVKQQITDGAILVLAPVTVLNAWEDELEGEGESYQVVRGLKAEDRLMAAFAAHNLPGRYWVLATSDTVMNTPDYGKMPWGAVVFDESTKLKNPKAKVSEFFTKNFRQVARRLILTGAIKTERTLEIFQQFKFLDGSFMGCDNYYKFRHAYFQQDWTGYGWVAKEGAEEKIKRHVHARAFVLRRVDAGMDKKKVYMKRYVHLNSEQSDLTADIMEQFAYKNPDGTWTETSYPAVVYGWCSRVAGGFHPNGLTQLSDAKCKAVSDIYDELDGDQMVVWTKYQAEAHAVYTHLKDKGLRPALITGSVSGESRSSIVRSFRAKKYDVLVATEDCAKFGIDCSTASCAVYYSNSPSGEARIQSEDRILHPTKNDPLLYVDLVTKHSVDEDIVDAMQDKTFESRLFMTTFESKLKR